MSLRQIGIHDTLRIYSTFPKGRISMDYCPYCGKALEEPCSFCPYCGKQLSKQHKLKKANSFPKRKALLAIPVVLILVLLSLFIGTGKPFSEDTRAISDASSSVVTIYVYDVNNILLGTGSGFAAIDDGIIVTNHHVIKGDVYRIEATTETGKTMTADSVIVYDEDLDIAILRFNDCTLPILSTDSGLDLARGEVVTAIGSPIGLNNMVSSGVLSQYMEMVETDSLTLLFTASISPGSSGGALFNENGDVIGITSGAYIDGNDIYYAVPFCYVEELYVNRSPAEEISPAKLWEQSDHSYTVDYVLYYPRSLNGKTIELKGYVSAVYHDLYLVADSTQILSPVAANALTPEDRNILSKGISAQRNGGRSLMCQRESRGSFPDDLAGKYVTLRGKVTVFSENTAGDDVRFIVSEIIASE